MPVIAPTKVTSIGAVTAVQTTLNGTDTLVYKEGVSKTLYLRNPTGGALSPIIDGDGGTTAYLPGVGNVSVASGFAVGSIAAAATVAIDLAAIREYLKGVISITGGTGLVAILAEV